jgi:Protein of unknown function (DUF3099)
MKQQSITTVPPSPEAERRSRMIKYTIAMSIRVACIFALLFVQGWWLLVFAIGAVCLPYIAVVLANVSGPTRSTEVLRPGGLVPLAHPGSAEEPAHEAEQQDEPRASDADVGAESAAGAEDTAEGASPHDERGAA